MKSDSQVRGFCFRISGDYRLSFEVHALNDALNSKLAAQLRVTECIWGNPKFDELNPLTFKHLFFLN